MLSQEQFTLMSWLLEQPGPVTLQQMADLQAPGFTEYRVEELKEQGFLRWEYVSYNENLLPGYFVSDNGKARLEQAQEIHNARTQQESDKRADRRTQIYSAVLGAILGALFTLLLEHAAEILDLFSLLLI